MPIRVECGKCGSSFHAPDKAVGKQAPCPKCSAPIAIRAAAPSNAKQTKTAPAAASKPAAAKKASKAAQAKRDVKLTAGKVVAAVEGEIEPVRPTPLYRFGILLSLAAMLLPLVYLALVVGACYLIYWHGVNNMAVFESVRGRGAFYAFLVYLAPLIAGPVMILFMIKPLFAKSSKHQKTRSLRRESEPVLFAFVDKICETVRSPKPKRIDIDCQVNASASFRKGMMSMLGNDMVLTIGMPLAAGMTVQQLGGVLAHEFGHFSQGAGMRLTYLVRTISHWFVPVVYERDQWDEWLSGAAASLDLRLAWVLWLAMLAV